MRRAAIIWVFGAMLAVTAIACSSSTTGEAPDVAAETSGSLTETFTPASVNVVADSEESGPWLGAHTAPVPEILASLLGLSAGERVAWVTPGGPADGLLILGDTIVGVDGEPVDAANALSEALGTRNAGDLVTLSVLRGGVSLDIPVTLVGRPVVESGGSLAEIDDLFGRALGGEFRFLDMAGGEHTAAFVSGVISGVDDGLVTLTRPGNGPTTLTLSPNVFIWIDGGSATLEDLTAATGSSAKVVTFDGEALAVLAGGIVPPALEALEGLFGEG
ncbi:MAG: PDZ domain-containing protein, partial [Chloroflexi bacterium]|nr:PDZ domain-containing protein [Chloroflexota bacterium]